MLFGCCQLLSDSHCVLLGYIAMSYVLLMSLCVIALLLCMCFDVVSFDLLCYVVLDLCVV